jgi:hypothetical protein
MFQALHDVLAKSPNNRPHIIPVFTGMTTSYETIITSFIEKIKNRKLTAGICPMSLNLQLILIVDADTMK